MNKDDFLAAALRNPVNDALAGALFHLALPDAWIVSGCLVQTVWNGLTGRAADYGIADYDVFYFDPDTSWQAEVAVSESSGRPDKTRRQGRGAHSGPVHPVSRKHGRPCRRCNPRPRASTAFLTRNTQVGVPRMLAGHDVYAPHGFDDIANMVVRPNPGPNFSAANYAAKAARWKRLWPELTVLAAERQ